MGAPSKRAKRKRVASEFEQAIRSAALRLPQPTASVYSWTLEEIRNARDAQMRGDFRLASRLADSMRTDDAIAVALENRLAPQRCIPTEICSAPGARGERIGGEADALYGPNGTGLHPDTLCDVHRCLVDHELSIAQLVPSPREDGSRIDGEVRYWPIEHVRYDYTKRCLVTRIDTSVPVPPEIAAVGGDVPIVHGDGRWVVFQRHEHEPWKFGALLSAALVWARHAFPVRDWAKGSVSHGSAKVFGTLPQGVPLQKDGAASPEAAAFLEFLKALVASDQPAGVIPHGSTVQFVTNNSPAWQVWKELVVNAEAAAARIYLGTDGTLGSKGGAPGVDIDALFGVAKTRVESDLKCIERAIYTGVLQPWTAMNFGDSTLAPKLKYRMPDADSDLLQKSLAVRRGAFYEDVAAAKKAGFEITQAVAEGIAKKYGVDLGDMKLKVAPAPVAGTPLRSVDQAAE